MVTYKDVKNVSEVIIEKLQPILIVLFGSVAKNGHGSDLDLLVVIDDKSKSVEKANLSIHKNLKPFYRKFAIDSFIITVSVFKEYYYKGSPFLRLILKEGRCVYMKNSVKEWLRQAEDELRMAIYLLDGRFFKGVCYHSQ